MNWRSRRRRRTDEKGQRNCSTWEKHNHPPNPRSNERGASQRQSSCAKVSLEGVRIRPACVEDLFLFHLARLREGNGRTLTLSRNVLFLCCRRRMFRSIASLSRAGRVAARALAPVQTRSPSVLQAAWATRSFSNSPVTVNDATS